MASVLTSAGGARAMSRSARLAAHRLSSETLLHYVAYLPEIPRAIMTAHLHLGMNAHDLALLHGVTARQMRRRLEGLRRRLGDPCFLLAAEYGAELPESVAPLARAYWIEGATLRDLARQRGETLHWVRCQIGLARSLLLIRLSSRRVISSDQACAALCAR